MPGKQVKNWEQYEAIKKKLIAQGLPTEEAETRAAKIVNANYRHKRRSARRDRE